MSLSLEYAMTHRVGAGGLRETCQRPAPVVDTSLRVRKWSGQSELCQSCQVLPSVRLSASLALCSKCHTQRQIRHGLMPSDTACLKARAAPQDDAAPAATLRGMAIVFNSPSEDMGFIEYFRPSAVDRTFAEAIDLRALWSHNTEVTIGRLSAGTLRARKASGGLSVDIDLPRWAHTYAESVARRDVTHMSFAFEALSDDWWLEDGTPHREVTDARIFEVSPVSWPAYPATTLKTTERDARAEWLMEQQTAERLRMAR